MRGARRIGTLIITATAVAVLSIPVSASSARLTWNVTQSAPMGLYSIERGRWDVGDRVAVVPSVWLAKDLDHRRILLRGKLLLKRVAAGEGDKVCREGSRITVNGNTAAIAKAASGLAGPLPVWHGCKLLGPADVFLIGDSADSYDGRYFGVTSASDVIGRVRLLASFGRDATDSFGALR